MQLPGNTRRSYFCHPGRVRVTSKGQVTIPQEVRRRLGIEPGSEVDFQVVNDDVRLVRRSTVSGITLVATMRGLAAVSMSTDEIMALTRSDT